MQKNLVNCLFYLNLQKHTGAPELAGHGPLTKKHQLPDQKWISCTRDLPGYALVLHKGECINQKSST